jgi:glutaconate CoA-transferase subunit B
VRDQTGFDFDAPQVVPMTPMPDAARLDALRGPVARQMADIYPAFAERVFGVSAS